MNHDRDLDVAVREALAWRADHTQVDPSARFDPARLAERATHGELRSGAARRGHRIVVAVAAALVVMMVAGLAIRFRGGNDPGRAVGSARSDTPAAKQVPAVSPSTVVPSTAPVGIFPRGGVDAVIAAGYATPEDAVEAYLAARTQLEHVPFATAIEASVGGVRQSGENRALVGFGIQAPSDGGDGVAEVVRVADASGASAWAVTQAFVGSLEVPGMSLDAGALSGSLSGGPYGARVTVHDAATGEVLSEGAFPLPPEGEYGRPRGTAVNATVPDVPAVSVMVWMIGFEPDEVAGIFGEFLVRDGEPVVAGFRVVSNDFFADYPSFADPTVAALEALGDGESAVIADVGDVRITATHDVTGGTYCVEAVDGDERVSDCWPLSMIAAGDARAFAGNVFYRIVPDSVTITRGGESLPVTHNVWWTMVDDMGRSPRYEVTDGAVTQIEGGPASPPPG